MNYYSTAFAPRRKTYKINELLFLKREENPSWATF